MSSWSCPYLNGSEDHCRRLDQPCVPGRPGCILPRTLIYGTPLELRIQRADEAWARDQAQRRRTEAERESDRD